ncbi:hypothetical protein [Paenibacillus sp. FSL H8-0034]|uniref:hypothetical protein n=1 Tax=Paenibacillus sp. FSL H8-0034 TaxID=2954671 RepID=UPI0030FC86C0
MRTIYKTKILFICVIAVSFMAGCGNDKIIPTNTQPTPAVVTESKPQSITTSTPSTSSNQTTTPSSSSSQSSSTSLSGKSTTTDKPVYTKEQLEKDSKAPSKNPADYNKNGEYVPKTGVSKNPADYNAKGEYKPADQMTKEEKRKELEEMLKRR